MPELKKATIAEVTSGNHPQVVDGTQFDVQFNPSSLTLKLTNQVEGGRSRGRQRRQYTGSSSTEFAMDLELDSADEGRGGEPVSVREKTAKLERFLLPKESGGETPPKMRFHWGDLVVDGIVESLNVTYDHFAHSGVPLRAKVTLTMKEQDYRFERLAESSGRGDAATSPTAASQAAPGSVGNTKPGNDQQVTRALAGESPAELAARVGLDPAAWRGLGVDLSAGLSLEAGVEVGISAGLDAGVGIGVEVGIEAGVDLSIEASFGLEVGAAVGASAPAPGKSAAGFRLSAAGGLESAIELAATTRAVAAATRTAAGFAAPDASAVTRRGEAGSQSRPPLRKAQRLLPGAGGKLAAAPLPPMADPRATTFGFGVPLRERGVQTISGARRRPYSGSNSSTATAPALPPIRIDPTEPPWIAVPRDRGQRVADAADQQRRSRRQCGCRGPCKHGPRPEQAGNR